MEDVLKHVAIEPGDNVVARFGNAVGVFSTHTVAEAEYVEQLIEELEEASAAETYPGEEIARRVAPMVLRNGKALPAFGIVAAVPNGFVVAVHGLAWARVTSPQTTLHLAGDSAFTWVERIVAAPVSEISLTLSPKEQKPVNPRSDLRLGTVNGDGLVIRTQGVAAAKGVALKSISPKSIAGKIAASAKIAVADLYATQASPAVDDFATAHAAAIELLDEPTTEPQPIRVEVPEDDTIDGPVAQVIDETQASRAATPFEEETRGSDDGRDAETQDGLPVDAGATQMAPLVAPSSPVLIGDDGSRIILDRNYVLGRDPRSDSAVRRGEASPITILDDSSAISRVHAYLTAEKGSVTIRDNGSTNGTYIASPGAPEWARLNGEAVHLNTGWALCLGNRVYVLHSA
ncbi:FHA domain-containing protein [Smaragdicoccus niigatensis]|uniref:FHA domain-containing protein n=1 Tax=Smaragdicoccus niigatensis TaxID=359359 RepID=UPI00037FB384|nr:FHA domain-containing protein [Smaragdicoccus niigatensis]